MSLILQRPGGILSAKALRGGTFDLFGCRSHPEQTKTVAQHT